MSFAFGLNGKEFPFTPGQFVSINLANPPYQDERGSRRTFSIASSPRDPYLLIATRLRGSAMKRSLTELPLGTEVDLSGPNGTFTLPTDLQIPVALIAGGIGITPFRSMIKDAVERRSARDLVLFYSNRRPHDAPFLSELQGWARDYHRFQLVATMTQATADEWQERRGRIDAALLRDTLEALDRWLFYVAGPPEMVDALTETLSEAGVPDERVRVEHFEGY
jgi:ferredoxin-NADP reductase